MNFNKSILYSNIKVISNKTVDLLFYLQGVNNTLIEQSGAIDKTENCSGIISAVALITDLLYYIILIASYFTVYVLYELAIEHANYTSITL